jgi:hypothetical protein
MTSLFKKSKPVLIQDQFNRAESEQENRLTASFGSKRNLITINEANEKIQVYGIVLSVDSCVSESDAKRIFQSPGYSDEQTHKKYAVYGRKTGKPYLVIGQVKDRPNPNRTQCDTEDNPINLPSLMDDFANSSEIKSVPTQHRRKKANSEESEKYERYQSRRVAGFFSSCGGRAAKR